MRGKNKKTLFFIMLAAIGGAVYYFFFRTKSAYAIAADLGFYTGDPLHDANLENLINAALTGGGTVASDNLEWELNDAAAKRLHTQWTTDDFWKVNGELEPIAALLATIDSTHDWKKDIYIPGDIISNYYADLNGGNDAIALNIVQNEYGYTLEEIDEAYAAGNQPAEEYIPQSSLNSLWSIFNNYKDVKEG